MANHLKRTDPRPEEFALSYATSCSSLIFGCSGFALFFSMNASSLETELRRAAQHMAAGKLAEAESVLERLLRLAPRSIDVLYTAGSNALALGNHQAAESLLTRAVERDPRAIKCVIQLAVAWAKLGQLDKADRALTEVTEKRPECVDAWRILGDIKAMQGRHAEALLCRQRTAAGNPRDVVALQKLGESLFSEKRFAEALVAEEQALAIDPSLASAHCVRGMALGSLYCIAESVAAFKRAMELDPGYLEPRQYRLMNLHYLSGIKREALFEEHVACGRALQRETLRQFTVDIDPQRKIRLAISSPDLRSHAVAFFIEPIIAHLDRERFEIILYHDHRKVDQVSDRLRTHATLWRNFVDCPDDEVESTILGDAPDILVELAGHTAYNRLRVFARRVAPVQMTYLGYPDTTGVPAIDYRLVDAITDPVGEADAFATEKLWRFSATAWCYQPPAGAPLPERKTEDSWATVTFGCFNNFAKISHELFLAWCCLLRCVPQARLVLKPSGAFNLKNSEKLLAAFESQKIGRHRIELLQHTLSVEEHLALYRFIDIALDAYPYHGTTTTCEALWMGVPMITRCGDRHSARVGASLLTAVGHPEWIAHTWEEYIRKAAALAGDRAQLADLRTNLRTEMQRSPLLDHQGQAQRFGDALRHAWIAYCEQTPALAQAVV